MNAEAIKTTAFGWKRQLRVRTGDDVTLCVERLAPKGECRGAVVLCHGLSSNGLVFDLPGRSLAQFLAEHGFECFIPDLRGARYSTVPPKGWSIDDYLEQDLPAIIGLVREQALSPHIHWIGHSLGGILFLMYGSEHPDVPIERVVTVASTVNYGIGKSVYQDLRRALPIARPLRTIPFGALSQLSARVSKYISLPALTMNFHRPNVEAEVVRTMLQSGFGPVPVALLADLDTTFEAGGFARKKGALSYQELWPRYHFPTLMLAGSADAQCSVESVDDSARTIGHIKELGVIPFGRAFGHYEDYGHFDLLVGRHAKTEVWPRILEWLV